MMSKGVEFEAKKAYFLVVGGCIKLPGEVEFTLDIL